MNQSLTGNSSLDKKKKDLSFLEALNDNPFNGMENPSLLN